MNRGPTDRVAQHLQQIEGDFEAIRARLDEVGHRHVGYWMQSLGFEFAVAALCMNGLKDPAIGGGALWTFAITGIGILGLFCYGQWYLTRNVTQVNHVFSDLVAMRRTALQNAKRYDVRIHVPPEEPASKPFAAGRLRWFTVLKSGVLLTGISVLLATSLKRSTADEQRGADAMRVTTTAPQHPK